MAMEACFQVSSIASTATPAAIRATLFSNREKLNLPLQSRGSRKLNSPLSSSSSSSSSRLSSFGEGRIRAPFICQAKNVVDEVQSVTDATWNELVLGSDVPVLVEFWAPWCGPCRMIAPVIEELAKEYAGKIVCFQVNTDDSPNIATKYGIRSIPTVLVFRNGEKKESVIGAVPKTTLSATIDKYLDN